MALSHRISVEKGPPLERSALAVDGRNQSIRFILSVNANASAVVQKKHWPKLLATELHKL
jgi:hypothetical protein